MSTTKKRVMQMMVVGLSILAGLRAAAADEVWPSPNWINATPAEEGMDEAGLHTELAI
jgi:hypothetical protein